MTAVVEIKSGALAQTQSAGRMAVAEIISHVATVQEVMRAVMKENVHFGIIPGTDKPTLLKPGAEVLCMAFRIADSYQIEDLSTADTVRYRVTCTGTHQTTGIVLGTGMGEASSGEEKYKWRKAYEPEFNETPAHLRRKKSGYNKAKKEHYSTFQVRTEPADLANTILKMANKRAKMAMVLNVTAASDCFSQDLEDMDEALRDHLARHENDAPAQPEQPTAPPAWPDDAFDKKLPSLLKAIAGGKPVADVIAWCETKGQLTEAQKAKLTPVAGPTYAEVADKLEKAVDRDALYLACDLIKTVADEQQRVELTAIFERRDAELA
jgi:hypothetical protein